MNKNEIKTIWLPFLLTILVIVIDQITKALVVKYLPIPENSFFAVGPSFFGDFLRIIHVRNTGVAFSIGSTWPSLLRRILFSLFPIIVLVILSIILVKGKEFTKLQRWTVAGIIGGGFGNIIDRLFRADGVVDFIDVKFYGLFGLERWPTWNIADGCVVVCGFVLIVSYIVTSIKSSKAKKSQDKE